MGGQRGVTDEGHLAPWREEADLEVVVGGIGREDEGDLGAVQFARQPAHLVVVQLLGIEHHRGGIAAETLARERVDEEQAALALRHAGFDPGTGDAH